MLCLQVKRETHIQYRYFNRQPKRNKEKKKNKQALLVTIKQKHTMENGPLQITLY